MEEYSGYVGLDVHKETISPALANPGRSKPESLGVIANTKKSVLNLVHRLSRDGEVLNPMPVERMPRIVDFKKLAIVGTVVPSTITTRGIIKARTISYCFPSPRSLRLTV